MSTAERALDRRWTSGVRGGISASFEALSRSIQAEDYLGVYKSAVQASAFLIFGEKGCIDWSEPPELGNPEERYLAVLANLGAAIQEGEYAKFLSILEGVTCIRGSRADSGGPPCSPELLCLFVPLKGELGPIIEEGLLRTDDTYLRKQLASAIERMVVGYYEGDRQAIFDSLVGLDQAISFLKGERGDIVTSLIRFLTNLRSPA